MCVCVEGLEVGGCHINVRGLSYISKDLFHIISEPMCQKKLLIKDNRGAKKPCVNV